MKTCKDFIKQIKQKEPRETLFAKIIQNIEEEKNFIKLRNKIIFILAGTSLSFALFILSIILVKNRAVETGFPSFFLLIFSDFIIILQNWRNFVISLLETLPIINVVVSLLIGGILFFCIKLSIKSIKILNSYKQNHNYKLIN